MAWSRTTAGSALHGLDLDVEVGEVFGFLGPNGSGKSTTIRLLLDLLRPTAGSAEVFGLSPADGGTALCSRIGYLPGELGLPARMSAGAYLRYLAGLRGGRGGGRIDPLAERLGLDLARPLRALSKGNKQRVGLVQAFMHDPELLVLDEPTTGLDPLLQRGFRGLTQEAQARGATVFLSSHVKQEVEEIAGRVAIIRGAAWWSTSTTCACCGTGPASTSRSASTVRSTATAPGYVTATVHSLLGAILVLVFAIGLGSRLVAGQEEEGVLELELTCPVSRGSVFAERLAVLWAALATLVLALSLMLLLLSAALDLGLSPVNLAAASTGLLAFGGSMGTLAFGVGAATGRRGIALAVAAGVAVASYLFGYLGPLVEAPWTEQASPYHWYIGADPLTTGFDWTGLGLLAALAAVTVVAGAVSFRRRDLMV